MRASAVFGGSLFLSVLVASAFLAHRHLRAGRGDRAGAFRLAAYAVASGLAAWVLYADHVPDFFAEAGLAARGLGAVLVLALVVWILYLAVEPYVRRRWPHTLIAWTRLLGGNPGDARVGGDVLVGVAAGVAMAVILALLYRVTAPLGQPTPEPSWVGLDTLLGLRCVAAQMILGQLDAAAIGMGVLLLLLLLRMAMPEWLAVVMLVLITSVPDSLSSDLPLALTLTLNAAALAIPTVVLLRFGLLAAITSIYVVHNLVNLPLTPEVGRWTGSTTVFVFLVLAGLTILGFRAATARRRG